MEQTKERPRVGKRRMVVATLAAGAVFALPATSQGATFTVRATSSRTWKPAILTVGKGSRVVWKNPTSTRHNVVSYSRNWSKSSALNPGTSTSFTFRRTGRYKYRCTFHSSLRDGRCEGMCGKVVVR